MQCPNILSCLTPKIRDSSKQITYNFQEDFCQNPLALMAVFPCPGQLGNVICEGMTGLSEGMTYVTSSLIG